MQPKLAEHRACNATPQQNMKTWTQGESPYTVQNLDDAIAHIEAAIAADNLIAVFGQRYWLDRVRQIALTPGIMQAQVRRLDHLQSRLAEGG
jgi:hypothetical protein